MVTLQLPCGKVMVFERVSLYQHKTQLRAFIYNTKLDYRRSKLPSYAVIQIAKRTGKPLQINAKFRAKTYSNGG